MARSVSERRRLTERAVRRQQRIWQSTWMEPWGPLGRLRKTHWAQIAMTTGFRKDEIGEWRKQAADARDLRHGGISRRPNGGSAKGRLALEED